MQTNPKRKHREDVLRNTIKTECDVNSLRFTRVLCSMRAGIFMRVVFPFKRNFIVEKVCVHIHLLYAYII